jgi:hypothetical protein
MQFVDYAITRNDVVKVKSYHDMGVRASSRAIALAIGWGAYECFLFLLEQGYGLDTQAKEELELTKDCRFSDHLTNSSDTPATGLKSQK